MIGGVIRTLLAIAIVVCCEDMDEYLGRHTKKG
jgi:hypothetical protein